MGLEAITPHGRAMAQLGLHPRLAHMLLLARSRGWLDLGCALAVLLSERDPLMRQEVGCDLMHRLDWLRQGEADPPHQGSGNLRRSRNAGRCNAWSTSSDAR